VTDGMLNDLKDTRYFSISFDASNKGSCKMFPFVVNYFSLRHGIQHCVLECIEQSSESAVDVANILKKVMKMYDLDMAYLTSCGADNTNVNFGCNHSVFTLIQQEQPNLIKGMIQNNR